MASIKEVRGVLRKVHDRYTYLTNTAVTDRHTGDTISVIVPSPPSSMCTFSQLGPPTSSLFMNDQSSFCSAHTGQCVLKVLEAVLLPQWTVAAALRASRWAHTIQLCYSKVPQEPGIIRYTWYSYSYYPYGIEKWILLCFEMAVTSTLYTAT